MRFSRDRRGQSVVVGTVILFGFLILALSLYQVQIVPQENAEVEFQHFEEVRNDMVELRAGILQAGTENRTQYETVRLGTSYPPRLFAINPPAPSGVLRTSDSYNITIEGESGDPVNISTRFIQYQPGYNEIDRSSTWYDASVLYLDVREEGGGIAVIEDQNLINEDGEVRITALQNEFRRSGTEQTTLDLFPADSVNQSIPEGNLTVTVPTRLSGEEYWNDADIPDDVYGGVSEADDNGVRNLTLNTTADNLTVDTVGVQEKPEAPTRVGNDGSGGDGSGGGDGGELNPGGSDSVLLSAAYTDATDDTRAVFRLRNPGTESRTLEEVRLFAYFGPTTGAAGGGSGEIEQQQATVVGTGDVVELRGNFIDLSPNVTIPPGETREITFDFPEAVTGDLIGVSFIDDRGVRSQYLSGIVEDPPAQFEVTITDMTSPVEEGETLDVTADVTNTGFEEETQSISLEVAGEVVDTIDVTLDPGQEQSVQLSWMTAAGDAGQYSVTVSSNDGLDQANVEVVAPGQPAGSVNVDEPVIANDGSFDVTTSDYLNLVEGSVVVENARTGDTTSFDVGETTTNVDTADIGGIQAGDEITATLYEDGGRTNELDRNTAVVEQLTYEIVSVNPTAAGGNDINVEFRINTNDPNAEVEVISLDGNENNDSGRIAVSNDQPQTVTIGGGNQADQVRVILYDESGNEVTRTTVPYS
ncbi:hypothetical protein DJ68_00315 [Halorubrum sp. C3]|nr:hypothetical protein DJ68_00315 [Halorubrum sp. C3]